MYSNSGANPSGVLAVATDSVEIAFLFVSSLGQSICQDRHQRPTIIPCSNCFYVGALVDNRYHMLARSCPMCCFLCSLCSDLLSYLLIQTASVPMGRGTNPVMNSVCALIQLPIHLGFLRLQPTVSRAQSFLLRVLIRVSFEIGFNFQQSFRAAAAFTMAFVDNRYHISARSRLMYCFLCCSRSDLLSYLSIVCPNPFAYQPGHS